MPTITSGVQLVMVDGQTRLISSGIALSGTEGPNFAPYTSADCKDWLGQSLPCSCPGAYSSNDYTSIIAIMTSSYLKTITNVAVTTTETLYATVGPPAQRPGDDLCGEPCLIDASEVQLLYWPVMAAAGNLSAPAITAMTPYGLVSDGFTFTSPSVYVAYRSLKASAAYLPFGLPIGGKIHDVTVGYPPEAISTTHCNVQYPSPTQAYRPINYTMLEFPPPNSAISDCAHVSGIQDVGGSLYNPSASNEAANPFFAIPGPLNWVDPLWSSCLPVTYGIYDPPRKLDKASKIVVPTAPLPVTTTPADAASPAATVAPAIFGPMIKPVVATIALLQPNTALALPAQEPGMTMYDVAIQTPAVVALVSPVPSASAIPAPVIQSPAPVVETPSYNSVLIATPSPSVTDVSPAPVMDSLSLNQPAVNAIGDSVPGVNSLGANVLVTNLPDSVHAVKANNPIVVAGSSPFVIAGNTAVQAANGGILIASSTYVPGSHATIGGSVVSVGTNNIVQDGTTHNVPQNAEPTPVLVGSDSIEAASGGGVIIASTTYLPGQQAQVAGTLVSVGPSNVIVDSLTHAIPAIIPAVAAASTPKPVLIGGNSIANAPGGGVIIASSTYRPGVQVQLSGTSISVGNGNIVVDSSTLALPKPPLATPVLVAGNPIVKAANGGVIIASSTYMPGAHFQISGTPVSVGTNTVLINSKAYDLPSAPSLNAAQTAAQNLGQHLAPSLIPILVGSQSIVKATGGGIVVGTSIIIPGAQATIQGHVVTAGTNNVIIDGSIYALPPAAGETLQYQAAAVEQPQRKVPVQIGGLPIARALNGGVVIGTSTVPLGSQAFISGTVVSAGATKVAIGSSTYALASIPGAILQSPAPQLSAPVEVAGNSIVRGSNGGVIIDGSTLAQGSQMTLSNAIISAGSTAVAIDGSTFALPTTADAIVQTPAPQNAAVLLLAGQTIVRAFDGGLLVGSLTIAPGAEATIAGHIVSAASSGSTNIAIDGTNYAIPTSAGAILETPTPTLPLMTPQPLQAIIALANGATISAGGPAATVLGTICTVLPSDTGLILGSNTIPLPPLPVIAATTTTAITILNTTFTANPTGFSIPNLHPSLSPHGPPCTIAGTLISLGHNALQLDSTIMPFPTIPPETFIIANHTITAAPSAFTLSPATTVAAGGSAVTVSGTVISLGAMGLMVGNSAIPLDVAGVVAAAGEIVVGVSVGIGSVGANMSVAESYVSPASLATSYLPPVLPSSAPPLPTSSVKSGEEPRVRSGFLAVVRMGLLVWVFGVGVCVL